MQQETRPVTAEELFRMSHPPEGGKLELLNGRLVYTGPSGGMHGSIAGEVGAALLQFVEEHGLGAVGVSMGHILRRNPDCVRGPDVSYVSNTRLPEGRLPRTFLEGAPTLAVEVVSPYDVDRDVASRVEEYFAAGAERAWVVRPTQRTITVHWPNGDAHTYRSGDVLGSEDAAFSIEGFKLAVDDVFA